MTNLSPAPRAPKKRPRKGRVVTFPRDAVLTIEQVARGLTVSVRTVERMDLPTVYCGRRTRRYLWGQILDTLKERAA